MVGQTVGCQRRLPMLLVVCGTFGSGALCFAYLYDTVHYTGGYISVRPIVCLKSNVVMTMDANGIWQLSVN